MAAGDAKWVPTRGLPPDVGLRLIATLALLVVGASLLYWLQTSGRPIIPPLTSIGLLLILALLGVVGVTVAWIQTPRAVGLTADGVVLRYSFRRVTLPWHELLTVRFVTDRVVVFRPLSKPTSLGGWFQVTLEQARAILRDSRCPRVWIPEDKRDSLGMADSPELRA
jgi:Bacterial PH domain